MQDDGSTDPNDRATTLLEPIRGPRTDQDVLIQIGDYHLGDNPDGFVTGPTVVIYRDGVTFADFIDVADGRATPTMLTADLDEAALSQLLKAGSALPPTRGWEAKTSRPHASSSATCRRR
jgi:hypothetical protein